MDEYIASFFSRRPSSSLAIGQSSNYVCSLRSIFHEPSTCRALFERSTRSVVTRRPHAPVAVVPLSTPALSASRSHNDVRHEDDECAKVYGVGYRSSFTLSMLSLSVCFHSQYAFTLSMLSLYQSQYAYADSELQGERTTNDW